jgi:hypothetical protein
MLKTKKNERKQEYRKKTAFPKKHSFQLDLKKAFFLYLRFLKSKACFFCWNSLFVVFQIVHKNIKCCFFSSSHSQ